MVNLTRRCNHCGAATHGRKGTPVTNEREIITEVRYVCPRCNIFFKKEVLRETKKGS